MNSVSLGIHKLIKRRVRDLLRSGVELEHAHRQATAYVEHGRATVKALADEWFVGVRQESSTGGVVLQISESSRPPAKAGGRDLKSKRRRKAA